MRSIVWVWGLIALICLPTASWAKEQDLGMTLDEFVGSLNSVLEANNAGFSAGNLIVVQKTEDSTVYMGSLGEHSAVSVVVLRDSHQVSSVAVAGQGDGTPMSGLSITQAGASAMTAASKGADRKDVFLKLLMLANDSTKGGSFKMGATQITLAPGTPLGSVYVADAANN